MENLTPEMIEQARAAESAEALLALAKESGVELTEEAAQAYFAQLHPQMGELSDDELDNVAGGGCYNKGELVVTAGTYWCNLYECKHCRKTEDQLFRSGKVDSLGMTHSCGNRSVNTMNVCGSCHYCAIDGALWKCSHPKKVKR